MYIFFRSPLSPRESRVRHSLRSHWPEPLSLNTNTYVYKLLYKAIVNCIYKYMYFHPIYVYLIVSFPIQFSFVFLFYSLYICTNYTINSFIMYTETDYTINFSYIYRNIYINNHKNIKFIIKHN